MNSNVFKHFKNDLPASIVVFFVALPLCLGIALASGAPLFSGIIAGVVGGIVVGAASGSKLGVSGPAAGLAVIVLTAIETLGTWEAFLLSVVLAGVFQILMGFARAGVIGYFFPSSVIKGMLTGIGLLIILKQIPHAFGYDKDFEGDMSFIQATGENTFSSLLNSLSAITPGAILISVISLAILILWEKVLSKKHKIFQLIQGPIVVIFFGIGMNLLYMSGAVGLSLGSDHIVSIPVPDGLNGFLSQFTSPDFSAISKFAVWKTAIVMAVVASLETLLSVEATDKLDPAKNVTPTNRELKAQGLGNIISGLIGGLPVTQVIVRSSANIAFGAKTKLSAVLHGFFLLFSVMTIASLLNLIPLASLAAVLLVVGYKLAKPRLFKEMFNLGKDQFIPFMATVLGILFIDLLIGLSIGMAFGIYFVLLNNYNFSHQVKDKCTVDAAGEEDHHIEFAQNVTFLNKAAIMKTLKKIKENSNVVLDFTQTKFLAYDVKEVINDFKENAVSKNIKLELKNYK